MLYIACDWSVAIHSYLCGGEHGTAGYISIDI